MRIARNCCLVLTLPREEGSAVHVHSAPLSRAVFDEYAVLLSQTFAAIHEAGVGPNFGPRFAAAYLRQTAQAVVPAGSDESQRQASREVAKRLYDRVMAEIYRLTNVVVPTDRGWDTMPLEDARKRDLLDEDELSEVDSGILFFTLAWRGYLKTDREQMTTQSARLWGGSITSSDVTAFASSLPTSTGPGSSGASRPPGS